jgi:hypothetical protein
VRIMSREDRAGDRITANVENAQPHLLTQNVPVIVGVNCGKDDGKWIEEGRAGLLSGGEVQLKRNRLSAWFSDSGQMIVSRSNKMW